MDIKNKLLDVDVLIYMGYNISKTVKATCIGIDTCERFDGGFNLRIKRGTLKLRKASRKQLYFTNNSGPISFTDVRLKISEIFLSRVAVRRVNGQTIERLLGIDLYKWSLDELWMRYNMRIDEANKKYGEKAEVGPLLAETKTKEDFIKQMRFVNNIPKVETDSSIGKEMLLDVCNVM